ncbi:RDD family protein (plasmid) [Streptomycetaceae bacterium NBC_01309]
MPEPQNSHVFRELLDTQPGIPVADEAVGPAIAAAWRLTAIFVSAGPGRGYSKAPKSEQGPRPPESGGSYANWGYRFGATLIATLIAIAIGLPFLAAGIAKDTVALVAMCYVAIFAWQIYQLHRQGSTGSTIGKKQLGIRVVRESDGRPLGFGMAFVRLLAHALDGLPFCIGFLWPLWDKKKQTFADKVCGSVVLLNK